MMVFRYSTTTDWNQVGNTIIGEESEDEAGSSVSVSSNALVLAVGSPASGVAVERPGSVRVFRFVDNDWVQLGTTISDGEDGANFGWTVSMSGNGLILAVGVRMGVGPASQAGLVYVYYFDGVDWVQIGDAQSGESGFHLFGTCLSLSEDGSSFAAGAIMPRYIKLIEKVPNK